MSLADLFSKIRFRLPYKEGGSFEKGGDLPRSPQRVEPNPDASKGNSGKQLGLSVSDGWLRVGGIRGNRSIRRTVSGSGTAGDASGKKDRRFRTGWTDHFIKHTGGEDNGGQQSAAFCRKDPLAQHGKPDGNAGLRNQRQAQIAPDRKAGLSG